jgi:hypothetical protein
MIPTRPLGKTGAKTGPNLDLCKVRKTKGLAIPD